MRLFFLCVCVCVWEEEYYAWYTSFEIKVLSEFVEVCMYVRAGIDWP